MKRAGLTIIAGAVLVVMTGCVGNYTSEEVAKTKAMPAIGSTFTQALHKYYVEEAEIALAESDHQHADIYQLKGRAAAGGVAPQPAVLGFFHWWVPQRSQADINDARARLVTALGDGHRQSNPKQLARAQVYFDCWVEEAHEDIWTRKPGVLVYEPNAIKRCRDGFEEAMRFDNRAMSYILYFDFDRANLRPDARIVIQDVIAAAHKGIKTRISIFAYTDTMGSAAYNMGLSKRRAESVMRALSSAGITPNRMTATWLGETHLAVQTPNNTRNQANRRAEITIQ